MRSPVKSVLLAGASAAVLCLSALAASAGIEAPDRSGAWALINVPDDLQEVSSTVLDNTTADNESVRQNRIEDSQNDGTGIVTVQQNNGNANSISAATAATGNLEDLFTGDLTVRAETNGTSQDNFTSHTGNDSETLPDRSNRIVDSFERFDGIATVQQNNGDHNEIGAATAVAGSANTIGDIDQDAKASADTHNQQSGNADSPLPLTDEGSDRENLIDPSLTDFEGAATVQQNNGNANAISAATSVAASGGAGDIDQKADADADASDNDVVDNGIDRQNLILDSFEGAAGIATVQQNNGDANAMSVATVLAANVGDAGEVTQGAEADGNAIDSVSAIDNSQNRNNVIDPSFTGFAGVATVQQNNGSANQMSAATAVLGITGDVTDSIDQNADAGDNDVSGDFEEFDFVDNNGERSNQIGDSFNGAAGAITVQQNNGDGNTINAATAVMSVGGTVGDEVTQDADAGDQDVNGVSARDVGDNRINDVSDSFNGVAGTTTLQQNNGNANTINAATAVLANSGADVFLDQSAAAGGTIVAARVEDILVPTRRNEIVGSFMSASGVMTAQQNNGDNNVIAAATAVTHSSATGNTDDVSQGVSTGGSVLESNATDQDAPTSPPGNERIGERDNLIDPSFVDAAGVITVQQNNGSNNVMATATGVFVDETRNNPGDDAEDVDMQSVSASGMVLVATASQTSEGGAPDPDGRFDRSNQILDSSFDGFQGIATVGQNNGDNNIVAASTGVFAHLGDSGSPADTDDIDNVDAATASTEGEVSRTVATDTHGNRRNQIDDSFNASANASAAGIVTAQQNNGNNNVVLSATGVVANIDATGDQPHGSVDSAATGDAIVNGNTATASNLVDRLNTLNASFTGYSGIATVQQNNGDNNVMAASTQVTVSNAATLGVGGFGPAAALADLDSTVSGNTTTADGFVVAPGYSNTVSGSLNGAQGIITLQQNNGSNAAIQSAISVVTNF